MIFDNIKTMCEERGMSISALERKAGLGNGTISGWSESSPRLEKIMAVANVLGVTIEDLIKKEE